MFVHFVSGSKNYQDRQCTYNVTLRRVCVPKIAVCVALVIQHAKRMRRII